MKFGTGERTAPRAKFHVYRGNVSPLQGEKPIFGPLSKNDTGMMAALRAGLPVMNSIDVNIRPDPLGELTALPQIPYLDLKGPTSKGG